MPTICHDQLYSLILRSKMPICEREAIITNGYVENGVQWHLVSKLVRQWAFLISICPWFLRRGTNENSQPCPCLSGGPGCYTRFAIAQIHAMWKCLPKYSWPGHLWKFPSHIYCDVARTFVKFFPTHGHLSAACSLPTGSGLLEGGWSFPHSQTAGQMVAYTLRSAPSEAQCFMSSQL